MRDNYGLSMNGGGEGGDGLNTERGPSAAGSHRDKLSTGGDTHIHTQVHIQTYKTLSMDRHTHTHTQTRGLAKRFCKREKKYSGKT